ncbi:hypothetical protein PPYR_08794 [Photinus pyralis]|uniref:Carboxylesterase type B domain-containing protein n=1 Tax=Photinus pyralis TaxID=7054 RepID=A0A5N4AKG4_PHOPY|nr:esterase FE4-like [Photinus pyralis]KAB0797801.1 hypothetical protein PPYR_08794 [Photinus pyralis]
MMSPLTRDFVSGAIIQSGSAFAPWALTPKEEARNKTLALANNLGCASTESKHVVECLRKISAVDIVQASSRLYEWATAPVIAFKPVVEGESANAFLPDTPENLMRSGKSAKVPVLFSFTSGEGILFTGYIFNNSKLTREFTEGFEELGPTTFLYRDYKKYSDITKKIRSFYLGNENVSLKKALQIINIGTDILVVYPIHILTDMHLKYAKTPVYQLMFDYRGARSYGDLYGDPLHNYGVCHCDELLYLFKTNLYGVYHESELEMKAVKGITKLWANFAKTGNPTPNYEFSPWDPIDMNNLTYYHIDNNFDGRTVKNALSDRISFWEDIASNYDKRPLV